MRWWLAALFALLSALTALLVAQVATRQADAALRDRAEELTAGHALAAAVAVRQGLERGNLEDVVAAAADRRGIALYVYGPDGQITASASDDAGGSAADPLARRAVAAALAGDRFIGSGDEGRRIVVALPVRDSRGALLAVASRPDLVDASGIVRGEIVRAAFWAVAVAALVGLLVAVAIALRLRRIAAAAAAIEAGSFDLALNPRFPDELGALAETVDRMRLRLRTSFDSLEHERDKLRRLLDQLQEGVVSIDAAGVVRASNEPAQRFLGRVREGEPFVDVWPGEPVKRMARALFERDAHAAELRLETEDARVVSVSGIPAGSGSEWAVLVFRDLTEQERRERAERDFVSNAAHELRTPLAGIVGAMEMLQAGAKELPADRDRFLSVIDRQVSRLERLARALLVLARAQTRQELPPLQPVALAPLLREAAAALDGLDAEVDIECGSEVAVLGNPDLLEQALTNLAVNAVKHGSPHVTLRALAAGEAVCVEIADRGPGISPGARDRVFDRFYSGEDGTRDGFGLGLAIVRESIRAMGGTIEVDSDPASAGTTVRILLASAKAKAA
jgi:signal transduction histidine kinase/HAMP domain-containing protein